MSQEFTFVVDMPSNPFDRIIQALFDRLGRMTEKEAAALVNLSPGWFSSEFKRKTGMKYRECQVWTRLAIGNIWLTNFPWLRVSEIAYELGYSDSIKFGIAFKKRYGLSPTTFRKSFTQGIVGTVSQNTLFTVSRSMIFDGSRYNAPHPTCATIVLIRKAG